MKTSTMSGNPAELAENSELNLYSRSNMDYDATLDDQPLVILHRNLYHMTLESKLKVFVVLFMIIVVPATIVFITCYVRDKKKQRRHELHAAALLSESPDPSLPYRVRLARPVPGSALENKAADYDGEPVSKTRTVSFAQEDERHDSAFPSISDSPRPSVLFDVTEENVFIEDETDLPMFHQEKDRTSINNRKNGRDKMKERSANTRTKIRKNLRQKSCDF